MKRSAVVICPGRGTYNKEELGFLKQYHSDKKSFISGMDAYRRDSQQPPVSELDAAEKYKPSLHNIGNNASAIIYTCAMADFLSIDQEQFDIVAVTGNSMGWYLALAAGGAVDFHTGMHIVNTMGTLMHKQAQGGQVLFPLCDDNWQHDEALVQQLSDTIKAVSQDNQAEIYQSIDLGSMAVTAANDYAVKQLLNALPKVQGRYPFALPNHGAFHSPLMKPISDIAINTFDKQILASPKIPLIDGRGHIWQAHSTEAEALFQYTFDHQVCQTYNYSKAINVACKEFAPDCLIILGPGTTLGPPTAQQLIKMNWRNIDSKQTFKRIQQDDPFVLSMGFEDQRNLLINS